MMRKTLTWDQGSELAKTATRTLATSMPMYFAHPHSPWERSGNEDATGLIREYLPEGDTITDHEPCVTSIAEELNNRPCASVSLLSPRETFERLFVVSTP